MSTTFSVIVTCYNYRDFVEEAVDSALAQTRAAAQVIVVDDGSTDGSSELLRARYGDDPRVTLLFGENGGQLAAFQRGAAVASGDVLCFDSYSGRYFKSSMEKLRKVINDVNFDLVHYDSVSLNDLYSHLGLEQTAMGDELGWQNGQLIEVEYVGILSPDGEPAISLQFKNTPVANWYKFS